MTPPPPPPYYEVHWTVIIIHSYSYSSSLISDRDSSVVRLFYTPLEYAWILGGEISFHCSHALKGKFSSGIEGALASTLNRDFNWKQLSEMILCIFLLMFSKFI